MDNSHDTIRDQALYYQQDLRIPMTFLTLVYHGAGFQQEPKHLAGLARTTSKTLFRGTPSLSREEISRKLDLLGAIVEANASETDFYITISCFSKNLAEVLALVRSAIGEATFPEEELANVKKQELNSMDAALQEPEHVLSSANEFTLFGKDSMGKIGSRSAVTKITRQDVLGYLHAARRTSVLYTTVITDLTRDGIEELLRPIWRERERDGFLLKPEREYLDVEGLGAVIVDSKDATNDRLMWSHRGIGATDERRFDLSLIIDALGSFEGFLFDELRNKQGWCYGAYAYIMQATARQGRIAYYSDPSSSSSEKLIPALLGFLTTFQDEKNFLDRFADRNEAFKNRYPYQLDLKKKLSNEVHRDRYGIPILGREEYNRCIDAVTPATARKVIGELFNPKNLTMVFYGDAERLSGIVGRLDPPVKVEILEKEALVS